MWKLIFLLIVSFITKITEGNVSITFPQKSESETSILPEVQKNHNETFSKHQEQQNVTVRETAYHVANFGLKSLRDLLTGNSNVIISPVNIYSCLGILNLGAGGETKEEIRRIIGPTNDNNNIKNLVGDRNGISYASALFLDQSFIPKSDFVNSVLNEYGASVLNINSSDGEEAAKFINSWVFEHTNGSIVDLLQGSLDSDNKLVVVSSLVFKAKWQYSFPRASTTVEKFKTPDDNLVDVELMHLLANVPLVKNVHFDAISLPYLDEHGMMMHLILPKLHGLDALKRLLSHFNTNSLKKLRTEGIIEEVFIAMPKINLDGRFSLKNSLKSQGVDSMFIPSKANFTAAVEEGNDLFVSQVYHSVHFEINEEGTVASAATASILTKSSRFIFRVTRPFIFIITDKSDLVLFIGAILNPK